MYSAAARLTPEERYCVPPWQMRPSFRAACTMRLQMHATDPDLLEPLLGTARSKGCIRIPADVNRLLDHYGVLDADYERAVSEGKSLWMLAPDREPTLWPGRYLVVIQTERLTRPAWAKADTPKRLQPRAREQP